MKINSGFDLIEQATDDEVVKDGINDIAIFIRLAFRFEWIIMKVLMQWTLSFGEQWI